MFYLKKRASKVVEKKKDAIEKTTMRMNPTDQPRIDLFVLAFEITTE